MPQAATTGNLENAQRIVIAAARYTEEHNAPAMALIEQMTLEHGAKQVTVPKVGQMTISDLVDGQDIVDEEEIGMTTTDLTSAEVGAKVILTDKLVRQSQPNVFSMVGKQLGDGMARKKDTDVHALYTNLNGGTKFGGAGKELTMGNLMGCIASAKGKKFGSQIYVLHHPYAFEAFIRSTSITPGATYPIPDGWAADLLKNFWTGLRPLNNVPMFEDGNLATDSADDAIGVIANKDALVVLNSVKMRTERERDASLRATEVIITADYGVFELDDLRGAGMTYDAAAPTTNA